MIARRNAARIGIDLGGTKIQGVVLEPDGRESAALRRPTPVQGYDATLDAVVALAEALDDRRRLSVGIGTPGSRLPRSGLMQNCNSTWLNGRPLLTDLENRLGPRVRIANDADCFALSEASEGGSADGYRVVFGIILGTGVGGGIVIDGRPLAGGNGLTGEWGHTPLPYFRSLVDERFLSSRQCYCGRLNCIETFLSGAGLVRTYRELAPDDRKELDAATICARAETVDGWWRPYAAAPVSCLPVNPAQRALALYCRMLARSIAQVINLLDPHAVVIGGALATEADLHEPVRQWMRSYVFGSRCETEVLTPRFGDASGVRGAAWLWQPGERADERTG